MNDDLDHDAIQCRGLALLMVSRGVLFTGPDGELYRVDPKIMPETFVAPMADDGSIFFKKRREEANTVMTWVNVTDGTRRRFADTQMDPYASPLSQTMESMTVEQAWNMACEWWKLYRADEETPDYCDGYRGRGTWDDFEISP